uniref:Fatty acid hydroxylase domain-containing protein n=1 Tax=Knipowitschia caucasica TaxID=637954 RepID=A0AAV2MPW2_KNICA
MEIYGFSREQSTFKLQAEDTNSSLFLPCRSDNVVMSACVLQGLWDLVRLGQERLLVSPYLPACWAFLTHLSLCAPFFLLDLLSLSSARVRSWRLGALPAPGVRHWLECLMRLTRRYMVWVLPVTALLQWALRGPELPHKAPSCVRLCAEVGACFLLFDALFFVWHYSMHRFPWLYRNIHQEHHTSKALVALAAQDSSGPELLSLLLLALLCVRLVDCHPLSEAMFHLLNSWAAVEDHCGYDLPWGLHRLFPALGLGGAPFHQAHHTKHSGNYAPYFTHWDRLFGTYKH